MTRIAPLLAIVALLTVARVGRASQASLPIAVVFDSSAGDLPQQSIRTAVGQELERPVRADVDPGAAALFILRDAEGRLVVRYRPAPSELEQTVSVATSGGDVSRQVALAAKTLVTGVTAGSKTAQPAPPTPPADEAQSTWSMRLSLAAGFGDAIYAYRSAAGARLEAGLTGPNLAFYAALGHRAASGLILGGELGAVANGPLSNQGNLANYAIGPFALRAQVGPFVDYYPNVDGPLHLQAGIGFARYFLQYAVAACDLPCGAPLDARDAGRIGQSLWGASAYVGIGHDLGSRPGGAGWFARTSLGYFADERVIMRPLEVSLGASFAWF
jgi:hypothetical protein